MHVTAPSAVDELVLIGWAALHRSLYTVPAPTVPLARARGLSSRLDVLHKNAKIELLKRSPLFEGCSKRELQKIASITDELQLPKGTALITEGERGREFFALVQGAVEVRRKGRKVAALGDGDFFGEIALVADTPRSATVTAVSPVSVLVIVDRDFRMLMRESPSIQGKVLTALAQRLAPETL